LIVSQGLLSFFEAFTDKVDFEGGPPLILINLGDVSYFATSALFFVLSFNFAALVGCINLGSGPSF
jgi:hypothetical protein